MATREFEFLDGTRIQISTLPLRKQLELRRFQTEMDDIQFDVQNLEDKLAQTQDRTERKDVLNQKFELENKIMEKTLTIILQAISAKNPGITLDQLYDKLDSKLSSKIFAYIFTGDYDPN